MKISLDTPNYAVVEVEPQEDFHFVLRYLRGRDFGINPVPPVPLGSPFARLFHGCYWMARIHDQSRAVHLTGPSPVGHFEVIRLQPGQEVFLDMAALVGFSVCAGGAAASGRRGSIHTLLKGVFQPACWLIGHPLPVLVTGPAVLVVYGTALRWFGQAPEDSELPRHEAHLDRDRQEHFARQVVCFPAGTPFSVLAMNPDRRAWSQLYNALTFRSRVRFAQDANVLVEDINPPQAGGIKFLLHLMLHLGLLGVIAWLLAQ